MRARTTLMVAAIAALSMAAACNGKGGGSPTAPSTTSTTTTGGGTTAAPPVYVVLFTHIEDNTPGGTLGTGANRSTYLTWRTRLITMAELARRYNMTWVLQPDWKFLLAAQAYEDSSTTASTGGKNIFRYLRDSLDVVIDPHSHENGGHGHRRTHLGSVTPAVRTLGTVPGASLWRAVPVRALARRHPHG
ncbi:MAG: hypothetical protein NUW22_14730 [Acidobacteria bacterium]|nr:hypothetical protein [Acidobacteriota bacterium]